MLLRYFTKRLKEINNKNKEDEKRIIRKNQLRYYCFPIILIISKAPSTINTSLYIFGKVENSILFHIQAVFSSSIGILNSFIFLHIHWGFLRENKIKVVDEKKEIFERISDL